MNIYFACSITGGRKDEKDYQKIVAFLTSQGHTVPTADLADPDVIDREKTIDPLDVYQRDTNWIRGCDILIAEISTPSHGVGYEIGFALNLGKPVICLHKEGLNISKMILGNLDPNLSVLTYATIEDALAQLPCRLDEIINH